MNYKLFRQWNLHDLSHHPTGGPSMCKFKYFSFYRNFIFLPILQISRVSKMLADEYGTASNIKSRVNRLMLLSYISFSNLVGTRCSSLLVIVTFCASRLSVLGAITSVQHRLKLYTKVQSSLSVCFLCLFYNLLREAIVVKKSQNCGLCPYLP